MTSQSNLDAALSYARRGWPVFAVQFKKDKNGKWKPQPTTSKKTNGKRWGATTDPDEIHRRFEGKPDLGIGIPTGPESGLLALDVDTEAGHGADGHSTLMRLLRENRAAGRLGQTVRTKTPSKGNHIILKYPLDRVIGSDAGKVGHGLDHRGDGGYIVVPPTKRPDGAYSWDKSPDDYEIADPPEWLMDLMAPQEPQEPRKEDLVEPSNRWAETALTAEAMKLWATPEGQRNHALNSAAFSLGQIIAGGGLERAKVEAELRYMAEEIGLEADEITKTIKSGIEAGLKKPRTASEPSIPLRESTFMVASELSGKTMPDREWLAQGLVPMHTVTGLSGDGGTGKSLIALQLAFAVATASKWLNLNVLSGSSLLISAEDDLDELHRRISDVAAANVTDLSDLGNLHLRSLAGEDALLATLEKNGRLKASELFAELKRYVAETKPAVVILDTLADLFPGNENDRVQARQFIGLLRGLAIQHECAVILLAHPSLSGISGGTGTSGSTGWNNSLRSRLYLERVFVKDGSSAVEIDPDARKLTTKKANYGRVGGEINLNWQNGVFVAQGQ